MAEGLSAGEAANELRRHKEHAGSHDTSHLGPWVPVIEALLLSVVTIVTAWAGFSAAKWSTESRLELAEASSLRLQANRALADAMEMNTALSLSPDATGRRGRYLPGAHPERVMPRPGG